MSARPLLLHLDAQGVWLRQGLVMLVLVAALAPSLDWVLAAWRGSPLDTWGWLYLVLALAWGALVLDLVRARTASLDPAGWPLLIASLLIGLAGLVLDLRIAQSAAALGVAWAASWLLLGRAVGLLLLPSPVLGVLSLPTVGYGLERAWAQTGAMPIGAFALKALLAVGALALGAILLWLYRRDRLAHPGPAQVSCLLAAVTALAGLLVAFNPPAFGAPLALDEQRWAFGLWYGAEIPTSPSEQRLYAGSRRLSKRLYATRDGKQVSVLIVDSDDVHDLHAPEYCLSGSGWVIGDAPDAARAAEPLALPEAASAELDGRRGPQRLAGVYWYSSPSRSTADLAGLRLQSRLAPGEPFSLYMISAVDAGGGSPRRTLSAFLRDAPWVR